MQLSDSHIAAAAETLARAFHDYPVFTALFPDPASRQRRSSRLMRCALRYGIRHGEVHATSPNLEAIAVWLPPQDASPSYLRLARAGFFFLPLIEGPRFFRRAWSYHQTVDGLRNRHARSGHWWYLQTLGVDPAHQRQGRGTALLQPMLDRLDQQQLACCLETSTPENVHFYQRASFQMAGDTSVTPLGIHCWFMTRQAK